MRINAGLFIFFVLLAIVSTVVAVVIFVMYYKHYESWPWSETPIEDYMVKQSNNTSLDPNTRNVLTEASKWVRVFDTLNKNKYVYSTNDKKYDMTVFRNKNTADENDPEKTPYKVVTKFLSRELVDGQQEEATPITSWDDPKTKTKVKVNIAGCGLVEGKENEYRCPSANLDAGINDADKTIEMFTTCGGN